MRMLRLGLALIPNLHVWNYVADCLIAMLPSCIQKIIKDITSNIYLFKTYFNMYLY